MRRSYVTATPGQAVLLEWSGRQWVFAYLRKAVTCCHCRESVPKGSGAYRPGGRDANCLTRYERLCAACAAELLYEGEAQTFGEIAG